MDDLETILEAATPGPWIVESHEAIKVRAPDGNLATVTHLHLFGRRRASEVEANARLIALAPDMAAELIAARAEIRDLKMRALTDGGQLQMHMEEVQKLRAENAALVSEGRMLAAGQCLFPDGDGLIGDDHGNPVCLRNREVDKLRAENAELRAAGEWQPIDTAPKDGTLLDLWVINHLRHDKRGFRIPNCKWGLVRDWMGGYRDDWQGSSSEDLEPTHWRPLPDTPQ